MPWETKSVTIARRVDVADVVISVVGAGPDYNYTIALSDEAIPKLQAQTSPEGAATSGTWHSTDETIATITKEGQIELQSKTGKVSFYYVADNGTPEDTKDDKESNHLEFTITAGDKLYLPYELLCRFLCLDVQPEEGSDALYLSTLNARVIPGGEDYYELYFPSEELFWLSQIIHAEAWQQPLAGQIGVGNVVLNRVDSPDFPSTVFDVIFDMDHNIIQFEPISNGSVYSQPDEMARIAACLCLEGYNTVGDSLYFVNPAFGSGWFDSSLDLTVTIGDHNFYSVRGA